MAERVVHRLELVEVDEEDGKRLSAATTDLEHMGQPVAEQRPVRKPGQWVVQRLVCGAARTIELQHDHDQKHCGESEDTERSGPRQGCRVLRPASGVCLRLVDQQRQCDVGRIDGLAVDPFRAEEPPGRKLGKCATRGQTEGSDVVGDAPESSHPPPRRGR